MASYELSQASAAMSAMDDMVRSADAYPEFFGLRLKMPTIAMNLDPLTSREQAEHEDMEQLDHWAEQQYQTQLEGYVKRIWADTRTLATHTANGVVILATNRERWSTGFPEKS